MRTVPTIPCVLTLARRHAKPDLVFSACVTPRAASVAGFFLSITNIVQAYTAGCFLSFFCLEFVSVFVCFGMEAHVVASPMAAGP